MPPGWDLGVFGQGVRGVATEELAALVGFLVVPKFVDSWRFMSKKVKRELLLASMRCGRDILGLSAQHGD